MAYNFSFFDRLNQERASEKVIELKQEQVKLPYSVIDIGDKAAYTAYKAAKVVREAEEKVERAKSWSKRRDEIAERLYNSVKGMLTVTPEKVEASKKVECECGAEVVNSNAHASWCPTFAYQFKRTKKSDNTGFNK